MTAPSLTPRLGDDQHATLTHLMNAMPGLATWDPEDRRYVCELLGEMAGGPPVDMERQLDFAAAAIDVLRLRRPMAEV